MNHNNEAEIGLISIQENDRQKREAQQPTGADGEDLFATDSKPSEDHIDVQAKSDPTPELTTYNIKLGWVQGVLIPCLLNIWGVILFLRIAWIVAQAGLAFATVIIFTTSFVCTVTALSLSAICSNGQLQGGGVYYIVSRSLGAELGASVGIIFAFANAVAASMNTIGFCESLNGLLKYYEVKIIDNGINDTRIVGTVALFVMCLICAVGMEWESKTQNFLVVIIVVAIFNYIIGSVIGPTSDSQRAQGFIGLNAYTVVENMAPDFRHSEGRDHDFSSIFAMFFPAMTGVQSGANICGDLKNPAKAIPKGTLWALVISTTSYLTMAWLCGAGALRDATGHVADVANNSIESCKPNCEYGLHHNYEIMHIMALSSSLLYAGIWAATLSTALTNLLSVPRLIQALGVDRIYPGLIFFSKPYGKHGEPYRGYVLTFCVSLLFLFIGELNSIAPMITNVYLASYALINFCTFHASLVHPINWRPTFRMYDTWLSLAGFIMCVIIMMIISWLMALVTILMFLAMFLIVLYRKLDVNWASSTDAQKYNDTVSALIHMSRMQENIKSYNPQVLVLSGRPLQRPALLDIGHLITRLGSFMIVGDISEVRLQSSEREARQQMGDEWLSSRKDRGFFVIVDGFPFEEGVRTLIHATGLGRLKPNILLVGFPRKWARASAENIRKYVSVIHMAYEEHMGLALLRATELARPSRSTLSRYKTEAKKSTDNLKILDIMDADSDIDAEDDVQDKTPQDKMDQLTDGARHTSDQDDDADDDEIMSSSRSDEEPFTSVLLRKMNTYKPLKFNSENTLDTWWLYDDRGLNILLPYIIARRGLRNKMPFRIFAVARENQREKAKERLENLFERLRIEYTSLRIIQGLGDPPRAATLAFFKTCIETFRTEDTSELYITDSELECAQNKTYRYLRLRELILEYSCMASLIVISLPLPRKDKVSPALYMAWLEVLSRDLPPVLFVRGRQCVLGV